MDWNRTKKNQMRTLATQKNGQAYKVPLVFPSDSCKCLKELLANKAINRQSFVIAIEKDKKYAAKIRTFLKKHFNKFYIHVGEADVFDIASVLKEKKIDYAFYDMCGNFNVRIANWFNKCQLLFEKDTSVWITQKIIYRKSEGTEVLKRHIGKDIQKDFSNKFRNIQTNIFDGILSTGDFIKHMQLTLEAMYMAFDKVNVDFISTYQYTDNMTKMGLAKLIIREKQNKDLGFDEFVESYNRLITSYNSFVRFGYPRGNWPGFVPPKPKKAKVKKVALCFADRLKVKSEKDLQKDGVKKWIGRYAKMYNTTPIAIMGGIRRSLTVRRKQLV